METGPRNIVDLTLLIKKSFTPVAESFDKLLCNTMSDLIKILIKIIFYICRVNYFTIVNVNFI